MQNKQFKIDGPFYATLNNAKQMALDMADVGYDGVYSMEGSNDPFYPLVIAAEHAPELDIATAIAVSFPRNPLHLAYQALDLQNFSKGKFYLGLGSQIKPHIEKRFGEEFSPVADRMKEQIQAIKAIFDCFQHGERLNFQGKYYRHTLMTGMFNPGPCEFGLPPILTGGFGPKMCQMAGEVADGLIVHPFSNMTYINEQVVPNVQTGLDVHARSMDDFIFSIAGMVVTATNEQNYENAYNSVRSLLAFYGSTPAYLPAMKAVGYEDLQPKLNRLSKDGKMAEMEALIPDEFVQQFAIVGEPDYIALKIVEKYGALASRFSIYAPYFSENDMWKKIIAEIKVLQGR